MHRFGDSFKDGRGQASPQTGYTGSEGAPADEIPSGPVSVSDIRMQIL